MGGWGKPFARRGGAGIPARRPGTFVLSEPVQQSPQVIQFCLGSIKFGRAPPQFLQEVLRPSVYIFALQQVIFSSDLTTLIPGAPQWVAPFAIVCILRGLITLLPVALILRSGFIHGPQTIAHGFHGIGLTAQGLACFTVLKRLGGVFHRALRPFKRFERRITFSRSLTGQGLQLLVAQLVGQTALTLCQITSAV